MSFTAPLFENKICTPSSLAEHIADLPAWLSLLPRGTQVLLQSNDYFSEPTHINCVPSLEAFKEQTALSHLAFAGSLKMKKYTRFMVIGTV